MLIQNFSERALECMRLAARSHSKQDRELFVAMARAWRGMSNESGGDDYDPPARLH